MRTSFEDFAISAKAGTDILKDLEELVDELRKRLMRERLRVRLGKKLLIQVRREIMRCGN